MRMEPVTLSLILLRVLSVYLVAKGILFIPEIATVWSRISTYGSESPGLGLMSLLIVAPLLLGVFLWAMSPRLAKIIVQNEGPREKTGAVSISHIQSAILATVGMILVLVTIPGLVSNAVLFFGEEGHFSTAASAHFWAQVAKLALGAALVVGSNFFVRLMRRFREFGLEQKNL